MNSERCGVTGKVGDLEGVEVSDTVIEIRPVGLTIRRLLRIFQEISRFRGEDSFCRGRSKGRLC